MKVKYLITIAAACALSACSSVSSLLPGGHPTAMTRQSVVVGLALGGGASKGFAHIGVLQVLEENHIPVKVVTGTSAGAVVGSLYAGGMSPGRITAEAMTLDKADVADLTVSGDGFIKGEKLQNFINQKVGNRPIQNLPKRFAAVATDFNSGQMTIFNRGNTGQAVRASASIPNVFQPAVIGGRKYVDGGLVAPVPVRAARQLGAQVVIAVDISARPQALSSGGFFSYLDQSLNIMSTEALRQELARADVVIAPKVQQLGATGGFDDRERAIQLGRQATQAALPQIRAAIERSRR